MQFFQSFHALGYSAINLILVFLVVLVVAYLGLGLHRRHLIFGLVIFCIVTTGFVFATDFLADQNRMLNDAVRADGGIKQNFPKN